LNVNLLEFEANWEFDWISSPVGIYLSVTFELKCTVSVVERIDVDRGQENLGQA